MGVITAKPWPGEWVDRAACAGLGDLFFPSVGGSPREAELICRGCPVKPKCAEYGRDERFGVWAGKFREYKRRTYLRRLADPVGDPIDPLICPGVCGGTVFIPRNHNQKYHDQVCGERSRHAARYAAIRAARQAECSV